MTRLPPSNKWPLECQPQDYGALVVASSRQHGSVRADNRRRSPDAGAQPATETDAANDRAAIGNRFPADEISTPPPPDLPEVKKEHGVTTTIRAVRVKRPRSRVVVVPRSFLNAGTNVLPGERKFLDYAFPPTHAALDVVSNTGGRVGWHHSPLPGPFFPQ